MDWVQVKPIIVTMALGQTQIQNRFYLLIFLWNFNGFYFFSTFLKNMLLQSFMKKCLKEKFWKIFHQTTVRRLSTQWLWSYTIIQNFCQWCRVFPLRRKRSSHREEHHLLKLLSMLGSKEDPKDPLQKEREWEEKKRKKGYSIYMNIQNYGFKEKKKKKGSVCLHEIEFF